VSERLQPEGLFDGEEYHEPESPIEKAKRLGLIAFSGRSGRLLMIDCDSDEAIATHEMAIERAGQFYLDRRVTISASMSGRHYYYAFAWPVPPTIRIALQRLLGSDEVREDLAPQVMAKWGEPSFLFERPDEAAQVRLWLAKHGISAEEAA
jgi:hypothetical protein